MQFPSNHTEFTCPNCGERFTYRIPESFAIEAWEKDAGEAFEVKIMCAHCPNYLFVTPTTGAVRQYSDEIILEQILRNAKGPDGLGQGSIAEDMTDSDRSRKEVQRLVEEGDQLKKVGDVRGALSKFEAALRVRKHDSTALYNKGVCLSSMGDIDGAAAAFRHATRFAEDFVQAWSNLGMMLLQLRRFDEADTCFDKAIKADPEYAKSYVGKGNCALVRRDVPGARQAFQLALEKDPGNAQAKAALRDLGGAPGAAAPSGDSEQQMRIKLMGVVAELQRNPQRGQEILQALQREDPAFLRFVQEAMQRDRSEPAPPVPTPSSKPWWKLWS